MSNETIPLNLFKANLELQLRLQRLMQENGQQWLENATRAGSESIAESGAEIESLLKAQNWQELATLPAQAFWRQFQHHDGRRAGADTSRDQEPDHLHPRPAA
ncbi:MAG: phasin family protein [Ottowia sp.]